MSNHEEEILHRGESEPFSVSIPARSPEEARRIAEHLLSNPVHSNHVHFHHRAYLGLATTAQLLEELRARGEVESVNLYRKAGRELADECSRLLRELPPAMKAYSTVSPKERLGEWIGGRRMPQRYDGTKWVDITDWPTPAGNIDTGHSTEGAQVPTFNVDQEIPLAETNAYPICAAGKKYALTVRANDGNLYRIWFNRETEDAEGSLRAKSNFSEEYVSVPVETPTQIPGIPIDVTTTGDMISGTMTFSTHVEPDPAPVG